ncbi:hypothetical protein SVIOM74S_08745 [Streptomyces violarus]
MFKTAATTEGATVGDVQGFIVNTANVQRAEGGQLQDHGQCERHVRGQLKWVDWILDPRR